MARGKRDKDGLTPLQQAFCDLYLNRDNTDTFQNATISYMKAGYSCHSKKAASVNASRLLVTDRIKAYMQGKMEKAALKEEFTTAFLDTQLSLALADCVEQGDNTNRLATLRLIGQRLSAYTDKQLNATIEAPVVIDDIDATIAECKAAKDAISRNIKLATG